MSGFVLYWIHLAIFVAALHSGLLAAYRRDVERVGVALAIVLIQIISLANGYYDWYWHLSGMLGISWPGN
jgi:hypothetical protein